MKLYEACVSMHNIHSISCIALSQVYLLLLVQLLHTATLAMDLHRYCFTSKFSFLLKLFLLPSYRNDSKEPSCIIYEALCRCDKSDKNLLRDAEKEQIYVGNLKVLLQASPRRHPKFQYLVHSQTVFQSITECNAFTKAVICIITWSS